MLKENQLNMVACFLDSTLHINGLVQERRNSIASTLELCLSCTNPSICYIYMHQFCTLNPFDAEMGMLQDNYCQACNISHTLTGN